MSLVKNCLLLSCYSSICFKLSHALLIKRPIDSINILGLDIKPGSFYYVFG